MSETVKRIFGGHHLRCTIFGTGTRLYATFDNFVVRKAAFSDPAPSRKVLAAGFRQVIIQTSSNDWYLNTELEELLGVLRQQVGDLEISRSVGFSMGAFGALVFAEALKTTDLFLVSPRLPRPMGWVGRARINCPEDLLPPTWPERLIAATARPVRSLVLFDPRKFDDRMAARWLEQTALRVRTVGIAFGGHPCTGFINEAKRFGALQEILLRPDLATHDIVRLKQEARAKSPAYRAKLAEYLASRKSRVASEP